MRQTFWLEKGHYHSNEIRLTNNNDQASSFLFTSLRFQYKAILKATIADLCFLLIWPSHLKQNCSRKSRRKVVNERLLCFWPSLTVKSEVIHFGSLLAHVGLKNTVKSKNDYHIRFLSCNACSCLRYFDGYELHIRLIGISQQFEFKQWRISKQACVCAQNIAISHDDFDPHKPKNPTKPRVVGLSLPLWAFTDRPFWLWSRGIKSSGGTSLPWFLVQWWKRAWGPGPLASSSSPSASTGHGVRSLAPPIDGSSRGLTIWTSKKISE